MEIKGANKLVASVSIQEIEAHPQLLTDFLKGNRRIAIVLEKDEDSDQIRIGLRKVYSKKVQSILEAAQREHASKKSHY